MTFQIPKYQIGDTVFAARTISTSARHDCPDCFNTGKWSVQSPAGLKMTCDCPRCTRDGGYGIGNGNYLPSLIYQKYEPAVLFLTIGSIRLDTNDAEYPVSYMCKETGVSSGTIWGESKLFTSRADAEAAAQIECDTLNIDVSTRPYALKGSHFSYLAFDLASNALSWESVYRAWDSARDMREIIDRILKDKALEKTLGYDICCDLQSAISDKPWRAVHPLEALVEAAIGGNRLEIEDAVAKLPRPLPVRHAAIKDEVVS